VKILLGIVGLFLFIILLTTFGYGLSYFFAPKYAAIDNKVFHESAQYNDGMVRDLENLRMQYIKADDVEKAALKETILHRMSVYPTHKLSPELQSFYESLK
jgi:hypothetical protein